LKTICQCLPETIAKKKGQKGKKDGSIAGDWIFGHAIPAIPATPEQRAGMGASVSGTMPRNGQNTRGKLFLLLQS
jgi:hypothetical protein